MTTRDTMLEIARGAILHRAARDGYGAVEYDPAADNEGYVVSLLTALRHWCDAHGLGWQACVARARDLFEEDRRGEGNPRNERPKRAEPATREAAGKIFEIVCESDWPERPDAWPEGAILRALEELRRHPDPQEHADGSSGG